MNIAVFTDSFLPGVGGTEKAILGLAQALSKEHNVLIACPKYDGSNDDSIYDFKVVRVPNLKLMKNEYLAFPGLSKQLKKELKEFKPDIIHCQTVSPMAGFGIKTAKKLNIPLAMTIHTKFRAAFSRSIKSKFIVNMMLKDIVKKCYKANKVFTVCNDMIKELSSYGYDGETSVIRNGAMFEKCSNKAENKVLAMQKYNLDDNIPTLLFVGHIITFKNIEFLLNVCKNLKQRDFKFNALFVGEGPDFKKFTNMADEMNLSDNVIFTGVIKDKKLLSSIYSCADLFTFASIFDNDPLVIVESACHKTPTLAIEGTGSAERIVDGDCGFLSKFDINTYSNKIIDIFKNQEHLQNVGINAFNKIPKAWIDTAHEYEQEFNMLIANKKHGD